MSFISSLLNDINLKSQLRGHFSTLLSAGTNVTWSQLTRALREADSFLVDGSERSSAVHTALLCSVGDMIDSSENVEDVTTLKEEPTDEYLPISEEAKDCLIDLLTDGADMGYLAISDAEGHIYKMVRDNATHVTYKGHDCVVVIHDGSTDPATLSTAILLHRLIDDKYIMKPKAISIDGHESLYCDIARSLSAASDINDVLHDSIDYFMNIKDASAKDVASYLAYMKSKWDSGSQTIARILSMVADAFTRGGFYGAIKVIIQIVGSLKDVQERDGRLELTDPIIYMPQAWIAGAIFNVLGSAAQMIGFLLQAIQPVIGAVVGIIGSLTTGLFSAANYAVKEETTAGVDTVDLSKCSCFPLSLCDYEVSASGYESTEALYSLIKNTGCIQMIEVIGGYLFIGLADEENKLSVSFRPGLDDAAYAVHEKCGSPETTSGAMGHEIGYPYVDYSEFGFVSRLNTNMSGKSGVSFVPLSASLMDNGLVITKNTLEYIWRLAKQTNVPYEVIDSLGVTDTLTDTFYRINCIFNAALFVLYLYCLSKPDGILTVRGSTISGYSAHNVIFSGPEDQGGASTPQWSSFVPIAELGTGALGICACAASIYESCIVCWQWVQRAYNANGGFLVSGDTNFLPSSAPGRRITVTSGLFGVLSKQVTWEKIVAAFSIDFKKSTSDIVMTEVREYNSDGNYWTMEPIAQVVAPMGVGTQVINVVRNLDFYGTVHPVYNTDACVKIPKYTRSSVYAFMAITLTTTVVAGVVAAIVVPRVVKWRRTKRLESQLNVEKAWSAAAEDPSPENRAAYYKAVRKANFGRLLWGGTKFSRTNYWDSGDPSADAESGSDGETTMSSLISSLQAEDTAAYNTEMVDPTISSILYLINKNIKINQE